MSSECQQLGEYTRNYQYKRTSFAALFLLRLSLSVTIRDWILTGSLIIQSWFYILQKVIRGSHVYSAALCLIPPFTEWVMFDIGEIMRLSKGRIPLYKGKVSYWHLGLLEIHLLFHRNVCLIVIFIFVKCIKNITPSTHLSVVQIPQVRFQSMTKVFTFFLGKSHVSPMTKKRLWLMKKKPKNNTLEI